MQYVDLESEQLDEGIKDTLSSIASVFKKNKVKQLRTKYLKSGNTRVFVTEVPNGKVHFDIFEGKSLTESFSVSNINKAEEVIKEHYGKDQQFEVIKRPSEFRKAATWIGTVGGGAVTGMQAIDAGIAGAFIAGSIISTGGISGIALLGAGISLALNVIVGTGGWVIVKASNKKRSEIKGEKDVFRINESAPPTKAAEEWIKKNKERFKKQYGDDWEEILYALSWKMHKKGEL